MLRWKKLPGRDVKRDLAMHVYAMGSRNASWSHHGISQCIMISPWDLAMHHDLTMGSRNASWSHHGISQCIMISPRDLAMHHDLTMGSRNASWSYHGISQCIMISPWDLAMHHDLTTGSRNASWSHHGISQCIMISPWDLAMYVYAMRSRHTWYLLFVNFLLYGTNFCRDVFRPVTAKPDPGSLNADPAKADNFYHINNPSRFAGTILCWLCKLSRVKSASIDTFSCKPGVKRNNWPLRNNWPSVMSHKFRIYRAEFMTAKYMTWN